MEVQNISNLHTYDVIGFLAMLSFYTCCKVIVLVKPNQNAFRCIRRV